MKKYAVSAILAGCCWGCTGLFTRSMTAMGLDSFGILFTRCLVGAICFGIIMLIKDPKLFRIKWKDLWLFLAVGIVGQLFFAFFYYNAINMMSVSTACILLYLSPAIVTILAHFFFKDKIRPRDALAVVICVLGCAFVSGFGGSVSAKGILFGLGSAVSFALINMIDRAILNRGYQGQTVNFYLCLISALGATVFCGFKTPISIAFASFSNLGICVLNGVLTAFAAYLFFSYALSGCESGKVSILASTEPVMATLLSIVIFHEPFGILSLLGIVLVLSGIVLQNTRGKSELNAQ